MMHRLTEASHGGASLHFRRALRQDGAIPALDLRGRHLERVLRTYIARYLLLPGLQLYSAARAAHTAICHSIRVGPVSLIGGAGGLATVLPGSTANIPLPSGWV